MFKKKGGGGKDSEKNITSTKPGGEKMDLHKKTVKQKPKNFESLANAGESECQ